MVRAGNRPGPYFDEPFYVGFSVGGFELGLIPDGTPSPDGSQAYWGVPDAAAELERLVGLGATVHEPVRDVGGGDQGGIGDRPVRQPLRGHREPPFRSQGGRVRITGLGPGVPPRACRRVPRRFGDETLPGSKPGVPSLPDPSAHAQEARRDLPWKAFGKVTDPEGRPLAGVNVWASCGMGTLRRTGSATSGEDGRYELSFGPGILVLRDGGAVLQAAIVSADKPGYFEENLNRQGGCTGADGEPTEEQLKAWDAKKDRVFLPGKPLEINFVMRPAGRVSGRLVDEQGKPLPGYSVSLTGAALAPASSVWASCKADEQGRFTLEDIPTTYRFQFEVRMAQVKPPWDDSWASAALRFEKPDGDLRAWFGDREIRIQEFVLRVVGPGVHGRTAVPTAGNRGVLDLTGEAAERSDTLLSAKTATLTLRNAKPDVSQSLIPESVPSSPAAASPTRLTRSRPNADGEFTLAFENPKGFDLEAGKHQVIFQVIVGKPVREKIFRQLDVKAGRYEEKVKINPDWIDDSRVSITFVTIQPDHNDWVRAFFLEGKGTSYKGIWTADGGTMPEIAFAK